MSQDYKPRSTEYERMSEETRSERQARRISWSRLEYFDSVDEYCQLQVRAFIDL